MQTSKTLQEAGATAGPIAAGWGALSPIEQWLASPTKFKQDVDLSLLA